MNSEYINDDCNEVFFVINSGENAWKAFDLTKDLIIQKLNPRVNIDINHLFDNRLFEFEFDGVVARLEYSNWCGTELSISNEYEEVRIEQIRQLANEIVKMINQQPTTNN